MRIRTTGRWLLAALVPAALLLGLGLRATGQAKTAKPLELDPRLKAEEEKRVAVIEKVKPSVVAIFSPGGQGGGSGVLIDDEGYALTNFHVVAGSGIQMKCGLSDGVLYDGILVGLDKVGDVALVKLLPKKEGDKVVAPKGGKFPFAKLGDSDKTKAGDWSIAMGNPFLLATDFNATVTYGLISGVHRYQYPAGGLLEYTDCIQIDTSINPGNSGGPLFNMDGELIGINGRGSFEKRGRVNSGVGYAISINQIKNFMGQLRAGMDTDHASLGAEVRSEAEDETSTLGRPKVVAIIDSDARRRGLQEGDEIVRFVGRYVGTDNEYKNYLGLYPRGWRVPLEYRRENKKTEILVRLMGNQRQEVPEKDPMDKGAPKPPPPPPVNSPYYKAKAGFANYYFNEQMRDKLLAAVKKEHGDFSKFGGDWTFRGNGTIRDGRGSALIAIKYKGAKNGVNDVIVSEVGAIKQEPLEPLKTDLKAEELKEPIGSGGLLIALYHFRQLFAYGTKGGMDISHGGTEPYYLPHTGKDAPDYAKLRVDAEVLRTSFSGVTGKWYFSTDPKTPGRLLGFEIWTEREEDPCEVQVLDHAKDGDRLLPSKIEVRHGNGTFARLDELTIKTEAAK